MMRDPDNNNSAISDAMSGRRDPSETLEVKFLQYADAHREHYRALMDLSAKVSESVAALNRERDELFRALRAGRKRSTTLVAKLLRHSTPLSVGSMLLSSQPC